MKKINIYNLYKNLNVDNDTITSSLPHLMYFNSIDEEIFCSLCMNNNDNVDEEVYNSLIIIVSLIKELYFDENKNRMEEIIHRILSNDIMMSYESKVLILDYITKLLDFSFSELFELPYDESEGYTIDVIEKYINIFERISKGTINDVYNQDYNFISDSFCDELEFLGDTELSEFDDKETMCMKRLDLFSDMLVNFNYLPPEKYKSVITVAGRINNINKLSMFSKKIRFIDQNMDELEFNRIVDSYSDEFSANTLELLLEELDVDMIEEKGSKFKIEREKEKNNSNEIIAIKKLLLKNEDE